MTRMFFINVGSYFLNTGDYVAMGSKRRPEANEAFKRFFANQPRYIGVLQEIAARRKGVGVADMTSIHRYVLDRKPFCDQSGNNINHPNDFISRLYTQVIIHTLTGKDGI